MTGFELPTLRSNFHSSTSQAIATIKLNQLAHVSGAPGASATDDVGQFREEYLRGIVADAMDEFCTSVRRQLWHMQYHIFA